MTKQISFQGMSEHTPVKEFGIYGVTSMRFNQFKNKFFDYDEVLVADVFCGSGENVVNGEIIDGSPISIMSGWLKAENTKIKPRFWFSDIRQDACNYLEKVIKARFGICIAPQKMTAVDAINKIGDYIHSHPKTFLYLVLDPNGPKDFPKYEVQDMISAFNNRLDIIPYISANAMNRQLQARNKAGYQLKSWLAEIENFDSGFVQSLVSNNRRGWIREPIKGDADRWTMLPTFGRFIPKQAWEKRGYVDIESDEGKKAIKIYCGDL